MVSSHHMPNETTLLLQDEQLIEDEDQSDWLHDMSGFLLEGRYPQGMTKAKR